MNPDTTPTILVTGANGFIGRSLVQRLPVMITPRWVVTRNQPIAVADVIGYLVGCLESL
jgi:uncharacterized protein YbjT (DUF2867 family)